MKLHPILFLPLLLVLSTSLGDMTHPQATPKSEPEHQRYDKLSVHVKGTGYVSFYGSTDSQDFQYQATEGEDYEASVQSFFAQQLNVPDLVFNKGYAGFTHEGQNYHLKLSTFVRSYSFTLLRVTPCPDVVVLPAEGPYDLKKGKDFNIPQNALIPQVPGFVISSAKYFEYDEVDLRYQRALHSHQGQYWKLGFNKIADNDDSYRYMVAHAYKKRLLALGGEILEDDDNNFVCRLGSTVASFGASNGSFSLKIVQEEAFEQSLVLTPDAIKTELDKTGKITLEGITFDFNKATLKPESMKAILSAVALMQRYPDLELSVHGHTDNQGSETTNNKLSTERAAAVVEAIVAQGIEASRLRSLGHGEEDPVASNETDEGRAQNRRVELHKERGGEQKSIISIDFIQPIKNSVIASTYTYSDDSLGIQYTLPHSEKKAYVEYQGTHKVIDYEIQKGGKKNTGFSRTAIVKNYENVLELYNAVIVGKEGSTLYFEIADRGDGQKVVGRIEGYDGSYSIRFLIPD